MSLTNLFFLIFALIDLACLYVLIKRARTHWSLWQASFNGHYLIAVMCVVLLVLVTLAWAYMVTATFLDWRVSLDPSKPKPYFFFTWLVGAVPFGIALPLLDGLHNRAKSGKQKP